MSNPFDTIDSRLSNIENILLDLKRDNLPLATQPTEDLLTVEETGKFLGLSKSTVYGLIQDKQIPNLKPTGSKRVYFIKQDLINYLKEGRRQTFAEIAIEAGQYLANKKGRTNG
jgi:excisionase family DNA binding protein